MAVSQQAAARKRQYHVDEADHLHTLIGAHSGRDASRVFGVSRSKVWYWRRKAADPTFHAGKWGGARRFAAAAADVTPAEVEERHFTLAEVDEYLSECVVLTALEVNASLLAPDIVGVVELIRALDDEVEHVSPQFARLFAKYHYTFKHKSIKHKLKFTAADIIRYGQYCDQIMNVPMGKLKYIDEALFDNRGPENIGVDNDSLAESYSVTLMVGLHGQGSSMDPVFLHYRVDSNTSLDFCKFVVAAVTSGFLQSGDVLVCDNTSVHKSPFITLELSAWLAERAITIAYLPAYSPELNPCTMLSGLVKKSLRRSRDPSQTLLHEVDTRFHMLTADGLERIYTQCMVAGI